MPTCPAGTSRCLNPTYFTHHFGLVSDFLSECWSRLRDQSRLASIQGRVNYSDALSGRDLSAVNKTVDGLLRLLYPDAEAAISDEDLEWAVRIALECRRRVKEQQRRIGAAEFRNTQFGYRLGEGVEQFVSTPELASPDSIGLDPLPPGQVWAISEGSGDVGPGLYRIEAADTPGSGARGLLNQAAPAALRESLQGRRSEPHRPGAAGSSATATRGNTTSPPRSARLTLPGPAPASASRSFLRLPRRCSSDRSAVV